MTAMDEAAVRETFRAWRTRLHCRLFDPGIPLLKAQEDWDRADQMYLGKAVGVMPDLDQDSSLDVVVGEWRGVQPGMFGASVVIRHLGGHGCTTHRSPLNVGWIHVLSAPFQRQVEKDWRWIDEEDDGEGLRCECGYRFKDDEDPCICHYACGGCCYERTVATETFLRESSSVVLV